MAAHGDAVPTEQVRLARIAPNRLGWRARSNERDRRPTPDELATIITTAALNLRQIMPLGRVVKFAVATSMRPDEICRVTLDDFNAARSTLMIRQRNHPRQKVSNGQVILLVADAGFDPVVLIAEQARFKGVASKYLPSYLGWRRMIERDGDVFTPRHCLAGATGQRTVRH